MELSVSSRSNQWHRVSPLPSVVTSIHDTSHPYHKQVTFQTKKYKGAFFVSLLDFVYFITGLIFTIFFFYFISLLDAFDIVFRIIYETSTELVHSRESL